LDATNETMVIDSLTIEQYNDIGYYDLSQRRTITVSADVEVNLSGVFVCSSGDQLDDCVPIAAMPDAAVDMGHWRGAEGVVMDSGWSRYVFCLQHGLSRFSVPPKFQLR
jgi:hypothetical protein